MTTATEVKKLTGKMSKQLQADLERMSELADAAQEHKKLEEGVKKGMKDMGDGLFTAGDWRITVESKPRTGYNIPDEIKAKYKTEETSTYVKWEKR